MRVSNWRSFYPQLVLSRIRTEVRDAIPDGSRLAPADPWEGRAWPVLPLPDDAHLIDTTTTMRLPALGRRSR